MFASLLLQERRLEIALITKFRLSKNTLFDTILAIRVVYLQQLFMKHVCICHYMSLS